MIIHLEKKSNFTFRGTPSFDLDILGKTVFELMSENLIENDEIENDGVTVYLESVYPFLTREKLTVFLEEREGSYYFKGGYVVRKDHPLSANPKLQTDSLGQGLFSLSDYVSALKIASTDRAHKLLAQGVLVEDGAEISYLATIEKGAIVKKGVRILGKSFVGENARLEGNTVISDSFIGAETVVENSTLKQAKVEERCSIGPFAFLRPGSHVGEQCRIGDFVEIKNSSIGKESKISHHAYVGDAEIGERVNIGCGVVFANYNGREKSRTTVGNNVFIGSNCNLIAPIEIADGAYIAAGTTLTCNLKKDDFCIGRCRETIKPLRAKRYYRR